MPLQTYLISPYDHTAETKQFKRICVLMEKHCQKGKAEAILIGNYNIEGVELDALLATRHGFLILEFKNWGGHIMARENGQWLADGKTIKGGMGNKSPFTQARINRSRVSLGLQKLLGKGSMPVKAIIIFAGKSEIDDQQLSDKHLGLLLSQFNIGSMNILMGQCYSGGFIDDLIGNHRIVATACSGSEQSWTCPDKPYDEFVYHWTCAVNGADETGNPIHADTNSDGEVSMAEAFEYAKSHDRVNETPQYVSQPEELGSQWTFNSIITGIDTPPESDKPAEIWSLSGVRRQHSSRQGVYILRQGNKTRKVIR